jgi:uncharacterized protein YrrD
MRTKNNVEGISVIALDSGTKLGEVKELLFDLEQNQLVGILLEETGLGRPAKAVPCSNTRSIGPDAVMIDSESAVTDADAHDQIGRVLKQERAIEGKQLYTEDGKNLGKIVDIHFDERTGKIEGYTVSGGIFADAYTGRSFIAAPKTMKVGKDVTIVPADVTPIIEEQTRGLRGAARRASDKAQAAGAGLASSIRAKMTAQDMDELLQKAMGRKTGHDVAADDGTVIVAGGQLIEKHDVEAARRYHKEKELLDAAGIDAAEAMQTAAGQAWEAGRRRAYEGAQSARAKAAGLFEQARDRFMGWKGQASDRAEDQRVQRALGRPVTRVILDRNDQVILNTGDIITHRAIEEARRADILDALLNSVHIDDNPAKDGLKAPSEGRAALKKQ